MPDVFEPFDFNRIKIAVADDIDEDIDIAFLEAEDQGDTELSPAPEISANAAISDRTATGARNDGLGADVVSGDEGDDTFFVGITGFEDLDVAQNGADVLLTFANGETITFENTTLDDLAAEDFALSSRPGARESMQVPVRATAV